MLKDEYNMEVLDGPAGLTLRTNGSESKEAIWSQIAWRYIPHALYNDTSNYSLPSQKFDHEKLVNMKND